MKIRNIYEGIRHQIRKRKLFTINRGGKETVVVEVGNKEKLPVVAVPPQQQPATPSCCRVSNIDQATTLTASSRPMPEPLSGPLDLRPDREDYLFI